MKRILMSALLTGLLASSASAKVYECRLQGVGEGAGWIPPQVIIDMRNPDQIMVTDSFGMHFMGNSIEGQIVNDSDRMIAVNWIVGPIPVSSNSMRRGAKFQMNAVINKARNTVRLRMQPMGFANDIDGKGACGVS